MLYLNSYQVTMINQWYIWTLIIDFLFWPKFIFLKQKFVNQWKQIKTLTLNLFALLNVPHFWHSGPTATNWVQYSVSIPYSSVEDVPYWENSQITAINTAEYILSWVRFLCSHLYWVYTQPHFFWGYKQFHEMCKVHKMKYIHQEWCLLRNEYMLSSNFLFTSV